MPKTLIEIFATGKELKLYTFILTAYMSNFTSLIIASSEAEAIKYFLERHGKSPQLKDDFGGKKIIFKKPKNWHPSQAYFDVYEEELQKGEIYFD